MLAKVQHQTDTSCGLLHMNYSHYCIDKQKLVILLYCYEKADKCQRFNVGNHSLD